MPLAGSRHRARRAPDGDDLWFIGDTEAVAAMIEQLLTGSGPHLPDRVLATTCRRHPSSTERAAEVGDRRWRELLGHHDALAGEQLERYQGRTVKLPAMAAGDLRCPGPGREGRSRDWLGGAHARL